MNRLDSRQPPQFLKIIADEVRWQLLGLLSKGDYRVQELVEMLSQPQNLVSYHLKKLKALQIVNERRSTADARDVYYSLDFDQLQVLFVTAGEALQLGLMPSIATHSMISIEGEPTRILILCTENSARSQIAEALLREMGGAGIVVTSAGTKPTHVHPVAIRVLQARNIDISGQRSKHLNEFAEQTFDYVITVCDRAREVCPAFPQTTRQIHWSLPDPAAIEAPDTQYEAFEQVTDQLVTRIRHLLMVINQKEIKS